MRRVPIGFNNVTVVRLVVKSTLPSMAHTAFTPPAHSITSNGSYAVFLS